MRILMLDKNWLTDRRIALMIRSLRREGHETRLLHLQAPAGLAERMDVEAETVPFPMVDTGFFVGGDGMLDQPAHVRMVNTPRRRTKDEIIKLEMEALQRLRGPDQSLHGANRLLAAAVAPLYGVEMMREGAFPGSPVARLGMRLAFEAFALPKRLSVAREVDEKSSVSGVRLTYWDRNVLRYAERVWRPDIVVANDYPTLRAAVEIKTRLGIPLIYDAHELYSYQPGISDSDRIAWFREEKRLLSAVDGQICVNEQHAEIMRRDSGWTGRTALCTNATNWPEGFDINKRYDLIRRRTGIPADHKILLFQGGINRGRRIDYVLKGLAKARRRDVHMVFITWGQEIPEFRRMARDLGIPGRVHFLPYVPWEDILFWAASADAGFMPYAAHDQNTAISSPNKMYEFIMAGTPMIGPWDLVNVRKVVEGEGFGVVVPLREVDDYARAIDLMFDEALGGSERFRPALAAKAADYAWDRQIEPVIELYREVGAIAGRSGSGERTGPGSPRSLKSAA